MERQGQQDVIGLDRLGRSLLRVIARSDPAGIVAVQGAPGSGKEEFFRRMAWLNHTARSRGEPIPGLHGAVVWYDPWAWSKQGNLLAGLIAAVVRTSTRPASVMERARELVANLNRLRLDGRAAEGPGAAFSGADSDPVDGLADGFAALVHQVKDARPGRLLLFIDQVDRLSPELRWQLLDGLRLMLRSGADATAIVCIGREAALQAIRFHEGDIPEISAIHALDEHLDLAITVPPLDVRRISALLREYLGPGEKIVRAAFGDDAIRSLSAAVAHRPLGAPRFLRRLSLRVNLLAEYAADARARRELTEAQWAWIILSERWPTFRRFMVRGGRSRWEELRGWVQGPTAPGEAGDLGRWLADDPVLADYMRLHAKGLHEGADGIFWLENLMLASGL